MSSLFTPRRLRSSFYTPNAEARVPNRALKGPVVNPTRRVFRQHRVFRQRLVDGEQPKVLQEPGQRLHVRHIELGVRMKPVESSLVNARVAPKVHAERAGGRHATREIYRGGCSSRSSSRKFKKLQALQSPPGLDGPWHALEGDETNSAEGVGHAAVQGVFSRPKCPVPKLAIAHLLLGSLVAIIWLKAQAPTETGVRHCVTSIRIAVVIATSSPAEPKGQRIKARAAG